MKKIIILISLFVSTCALAAQVDPLWRLQRAMIGPHFGMSQIIGVDKALGVEEEPLIEVFVKTTDTTLTAERIRSCGGKVRTITRTIITAALPAFVLEIEAAGWTEAEYIEAAKPMSPQNDLADADTGVTTAQAGTDLPYGFNGTGVIIGIIDSGIDLTHDAFKSESGKTRILYLWDQEGTTGTGPSEIESTYGTEYTQSQIDAGSASEKDTDGHGTHVAGIAGGRDSTYSGVAPRASFIIVGNSSHNSTTATDAAYYIFQKAAALGMPAVINMSLGSDYGAHDGTSVEEQALDELVSESPGRAIVVSAGNSANPSLDIIYMGYAHIGYEMTTSIDEGSFLKTYASTLIDIWGSQSCDVNIKFGVWNDDGTSPLAESAFVINGDPIPLSDSLSTLADYEINRTESSNSLNGKWHTYIIVVPTEYYSLSSNKFSIVFHVNSGTCSDFDAWTQPYEAAIFLASNDIKNGVQYNSGDNNSTVGIPSTASNVISVGAYATRKIWTDSTGENQDDPYDSITQLSDLATFSSRGPALNPTNQGTKPNIAAPGAYLISAMSADSAPESKFIIDAKHVAEPGTSMSSPHVTGIVALMLQAYPSLTYSEIIDYLQTKARTDSYVDTVPNNDWGYGKVDALAAVKAVIADNPSSDDSNLTVPGITSGETRADYAMNKISVSFPRPVDTSTINSNNLYVNTLTAGSSLSQSTAWTPSPCDPEGDEISSTVALNGSQTAEITLSEAIGLGDYAICLSPNVKDTDGTTFWGKTVQFGTSLPNTGCSLISSTDNGSANLFLILLALIGALSITRFKKLTGVKKCNEKNSH